MVDFNTRLMMNPMYQQGLSMMRGESLESGLKRAQVAQQMQAQQIETQRQEQARQILGQVTGPDGFNLSREQLSALMATSPELAIKLLEQQRLREKEAGRQEFLQKALGGGTGGAASGNADALLMQGLMTGDESLVGASQILQKRQEAQAEKDLIQKEKENEALDVSRKAEQTVQLIDNMLEHPGFESAVGNKAFEPDYALGIKSEPIQGTDSADFEALRDQLGGKVFMEAYQSLKGGGQITEIESQKAEAAYTAMLDPNISEEAFKREAAKFKEAVREGARKMKERAGLSAPDAAQATPDGALAELRRRGLID